MDSQKILNNISVALEVLNFFNDLYEKAKKNKESEIVIKLDDIDSQLKLNKSPEDYLKEAGE